jgi:hypothetical protein
MINMPPPIKRPTLGIQRLGVSTQWWAIELYHHVCPYPYLFMAQPSITERRLELEWTATAPIAGNLLSATAFPVGKHISKNRHTNAQGLRAYFGHA